MADSFENFIKSIPPVTKYYFGATFVLAALSTFSIINPFNLALLYPYIIKNFQLWRIFTCFLFFGNFSINYLFQAFFLISYCGKLEQYYTTMLYGNSSSTRGRGEMIYCLFFGIFSLLIISYICSLSIINKPLYFLSSSMLNYIIYIYSRTNPHAQVQFWGFGFKLWHLPFVLTVFTVLMGGSPFLEILGILVGHLYHFLSKILPNSSITRSDVLRYTREWFINKYERLEHLYSSDDSRGGGGWSYGRGHRLD